jgi:single-strand DNA-binding protein
MASFNHVLLLGNLTRDPEVRSSPSGTVVATFGVAINRRYRQDDAWQEEVCYVDVVAFGPLAETVGVALKQGHLTMVEGRLHWRKWETADSQRRSKLDVVAHSVQFLPQTSAAGADLSYPDATPVMAHKEGVNEN